MTTLLPVEIVASGGDGVPPSPRLAAYATALAAAPPHQALKSELKDVSALWLTSTLRAKSGYLAATDPSIELIVGPYEGPHVVNIRTGAWTSSTTADDMQQFAVHDRATHAHEGYVFITYAAPPAPEVP